MICVVSTDVARYQKPRTTRKHTKRAFDPCSPNSQPPGIGVAHTVCRCELFSACGQTMLACSGAAVQCCRGNLRETQTAFQARMSDFPGCMLVLIQNASRKERGLLCSNTLHGQGQFGGSSILAQGASTPLQGGGSYALAATAAANQRVASGPHRTDLTAFVEGQGRDQDQDQDHHQLTSTPLMTLRPTIRLHSRTTYFAALVALEGQRVSMIEIGSRRPASVQISSLPSPTFSLSSTLNLILNGLGPRSLLSMFYSSISRRDILWLWL
jgi:hypothetical protein